MKRTDDKFNFEKCAQALAHHNISFERKRIMVAFADVIGFTRWYMRAANAPEDRTEFIENMYRKLSYMKELGFFVKTMGDGAMLVKELEPGHNRGLMIDALRELYCLYLYIRYLIARTAFPRPEGFRIRMAAGSVTKIITSFCSMECKLKSDYVGYPVNLASRLLRVDKLEHPFICHESVKDVIGDIKLASTEIIFSRVEVKDHRIDGIDPQDFKSLWSIQFDGKHPKEIGK